MIATAFHVLVLGLLVGCGDALETETVEGQATLRLDFASHQVQAERDGRVLRAPVPESLADQVDALGESLAAGDEALELRRAIGAAVLGPLEGVLRDSDRWIARTTGAEPLPGPLATLPAWSLPWEADRPVGARHVIQLDWPEQLSSVRPHAREPRGDGVLLVAPFRPGLDPAADDPDTVRAALNRAAARVEMIPRNDVDAVTLRRALEGGGTAMLWFRGTRPALDALRGAYGAFPPIFVWSLPGDLEGARPALLPSSLASGGTGPDVVVFQAWAVGDPAVARFARAWTDAVAAGAEADVALRAFRRTSWQERRPAREWASFGLVGSSTAAPRRLPWLQRSLRGGN